MNGKWFCQAQCFGHWSLIFDKLTNKQCNLPRQKICDLLELGFVIKKRWEVATFTTCKF
jgi:hypothetical protein